MARIEREGYVVGYDPTAPGHSQFYVSCKGRRLLSRARFAEAYSTLVASGMHWADARAALDDVRHHPPENAGGPR